MLTKCWYNEQTAVLSGWNQSHTDAMNNRASINYLFLMMKSDHAVPWSLLLTYFINITNLFILSLLNINYYLMNIISIILIKLYIFLMWSSRFQTPWRLPCFRYSISHHYKWSHCIKAEVKEASHNCHQHKSCNI